MWKFNMFITAVCVLFLIKLRWSKNKSIYDRKTDIFLISSNLFLQLNYKENVGQQVIMIDNDQ